MTSAGAPPPRRGIGAFHATMLVLGGIVGVGIFFTPAQVAALVPEPAPFLAAWGLGALVALAGAATFAELGGTFPRSGGWFEFLRETWGPAAAFLFAWVVLGVVATGAMAVIASFAASQLAALVPGVGGAGTGEHLALAALVLVAVHALVLGGVRLGAATQSAVMVLKLAGVVALAAAGLALVGPDAPAEAQAAGPGRADRGASGGWGGLVPAFLPVLFAYGGWQHLCYVAGEVRDPRRTLPRALVAGVLGVGALYLLANGAFLRALGPEGMAGDPGFAAAFARRALGDGGATAITALMALSALGVLVVNALVTPQVLVAMARSGLFFRAFATLHPRTGAPVPAVLAQVALALGYLFASHADAWLPLPEDAARFDADALVGSVVFAEWLFHGLVALGLLRLRRRRPDLPRPWRSPLFPLAPLVYLAAAVAVVPGNLVASPPSRTALGCGVLAAGAVAYALWPGARAGRAGRADAPRDGADGRGT